MAEFMFRDLARKAGRAEEFEVSSAAVSYEEQGNDMYPPAKSCLRAHGVPFSRHSAHRITKEEYAAADLVIVMDGSNLRLLERIVGRDAFAAGIGSGHASSGSISGSGHGTNAAPTKVRKMMSFTGSTADVADPWYTGDFERTYSDVLAACTAMLQQL